MSVKLTSSAILSRSVCQTRPDFKKSVVKPELAPVAASPLFRHRKEIAWPKTKDLAGRTQSRSLFKACKSIDHLGQKTVFNIEKNLGNQLHSLTIQETITPASLKFFGDAFDQFIESNEFGRSLLSKIKEAYQTYIQQQDEELKELRDTLKLARADMKGYNKKVKSLAQENLDLSENIKTLQKSLVECQTKQFTQFVSSSAIEVLANKYKRVKSLLRTTTKKYHEVKLEKAKCQKTLEVVKAEASSAILEAQVNPRNNEKLWIEIPSYQELSSRVWIGSDDEPIDALSTTLQNY